MNQDMDVDDMVANSDDDGVVPDESEATAPAATVPPLLPPLLVAAAASNAENGIGGVDDNDTAADDGAFKKRKSDPQQQLGAPPPKFPKTNPAKNSPKKSKSLLKRVAKTSLHFKSDVALADHADHQRGILHATRGAFVSPHQPGGPREDHTFAWIGGNADDPAVAHAAVGYFMARGFRASQMRFIPFSSREGWAARYPHAAPRVSVDDLGRITACAPPPELEEDGEIAGMNPPKITSWKKKTKKKPPPRLLAHGRLPDPERDALHLEIYKYLSWLHDELAELETSSAGRRRVAGAGTHVPGLRSLVIKLEGTFRAVQVEKERALEAQEAEEFRDNCDRIGGDSEPRELPPLQENASQKREEEEKLTTKITDMPFLEKALETELQRMVVDKKVSNPSSTKGGGDATDGHIAKEAGEASDEHDIETCERREKAIWRKADFETMYQKLLLFKAEEGHVSPPVKHPELGRWVSELRRKKRILRTEGLEYESDALEAEVLKTEEVQNSANMPELTSPVAGGEPGVPSAAAYGNGVVDTVGTEGELKNANMPDLVLQVAGGEARDPIASADAKHTEELLKLEGEEGNPDSALIKALAMTAVEGELKRSFGNPHAALAMAAAEGELKSSLVSSQKEGARSADPRNTNTFLTCSRVQLLDSVDFVWRHTRERVTSDERLEHLRQFKEQHGKWPNNRDGAIGNWLKNQKKLYSKKDATFMANLCPKMEAMGVPLRQRNFTAMSWEDRFQQLVEFGRVNRHFKVPNPAPDNGEGRLNLQDLSSDVAEANRFYKFVQKLHTEYRALRRGIPSSVLTEERITQLGAIGFEFSSKVKVEKEVPRVDWSTRIQQLEAFRTEMGHLRVDSNYDKYSNLGGWAVEMSGLHRRWQEGSEYLAPDMIQKCNQLTEMGFTFDIFPTRRGERSWEDSYELLLKYRQETGSTRVPHHYKADFRLGSWVAVQRKEYKVLMEEKPSRMTHEKVERLEAVGFEWAVRRGKSLDAPSQVKAEG